MNKMIELCIELDAQNHPGKYLTISDSMESELIQDLKDVFGLDLTNKSKIYVKIIEDPMQEVKIIYTGVPLDEQHGTK